MIGSLRGRVIEVRPGTALIEVAGVGYAVRASTSTLSGFAEGKDVFVYTHDHVREDAHDLFAFVSRSEQELFERLLSVSGVGPKVALTILSAGAPESVKKAILDGDLTFLTSTPGVGKKTAQKIVLDLKGQLVDADPAAAGPDAEAVMALEGLGYQASVAREALKRVSAEVKGVEARIREALKWLSK